jgi:hypothetical protein
MYTLLVLAIGVVSVAFFVIILGGLVQEMGWHKRRNSQIDSVDVIGTTSKENNSGV